MKAHNKTDTLLKRQRRMRSKRELPLHLMLLPGVILLFIFSYIPMGGIVIAFQRFIPAKGLFGDQQWVGLDNFRYIFTMPNVPNVIRNTLVMALGKIVLNMLVPIAVALLLNELTRRRFKRVIQTIIYFPNFISWVVLAGILTDLLSPQHGIVNQLIKAFGGEAIFFLGDETWFPVTMILTDVWKNFGFGTVIYLASITSIDPGLYEAAAIDGASRWKQTWHITLPGMRMIIVLLLVMNLGNILSAGFEQIYNMYNTSVLETGDILDTLIYRTGLVAGQYGPATALGLFKSLVSTLLISAAYLFAYKVFDYEIF